MEVILQRVQVIAHRGASAYAPENTCAAFDLALKMGADALETDIRASRDGVLVLCHDAAVDRTSNGHGEVATLTLDELRRLDFGGWFAPRFAGERLLTVDEFLSRYGHRCPLAIEVKAEGIEERLLSLVARAGLLGAVLFTSFSPGYLDRIRRIDPAAQVGYLTRRFDEATIDLVRRKGFAQICPAGVDATPELVQRAHAVGLLVRAWGIRDEETQERALQAGVDGMTVNWPDRLLARLRALAWRQ